MGLRIKFKFKPGHLDFIPREHDKIKSIFWNLTNECTHNCIFCYANGGILKENELNLEECLNFIGPLKLNRSELPQLMELCREKGVETFFIYKPIPTGRGEKCKENFIPENEFIPLIDNIFDKFFEEKPNWLIKVEIPYFSFSKLAEKYKNRRVRSLPCRAGEYFVGLTSDGYIIPCPGLEYEEFYCGNIREKDLEEILENEILDNFRKRE
jgi:MoaA/NifB/PqqE/SkfB family radical SAM enzyme